MTSWWRIPERRPSATLLTLGLLFALAYGASLVIWPKPDGRIVLGDAVHYYVYLRSLVFDGDLRFQNEYMTMYGLTREGPETAWVFETSDTGHVRNLMSVGPAIAWAPLYLIVAAAVGLLRWMGLDYPLDGFGRPFQAAAGFSGIIAATVGAWLTYRAAARLVGPRTAIWATLAIWLGSSALYYSLVSPTYSHAVSMLTSSAFVLAWLRHRDAGDWRHYAFLGLLAGLAALVRWQDAILLVIPGLDALRSAMRDPGNAADRAWRLAGRWTVLAVCAVAAFAPQLAAWQVLYGRPFLVPQGESFMRWTDPALLQVLVSDKHGLFSWTPILVPAVAGLVPLWRRQRDIAVAAAVVLALSWYVNAAVADWWAGEAFGARRFVSDFPFFVIGLGALLERWENRPHLLVGAMAVAIALNLLLLLQYQTFMKGWRDLAPYPAGFTDLWLTRFVVPWRVIGRLLGACC